jgi:hypothetical protein
MDKNITPSKPNGQINPYTEELAVGQEFIGTDSYANHIIIKSIKGDKIYVDEIEDDGSRHGYGELDRDEFTGERGNRYIRLVGTWEEEWEKAAMIFADSSAYEEITKEAPEDHDTTTLVEHAQTKDQVQSQIDRLATMRLELDKATSMIELRKNELEHMLAFFAAGIAAGGGSVIVLVLLVLAVVLAVLAFFNVNLPFLALGWAALASLILAFILGVGIAH